MTLIKMEVKALANLFKKALFAYGLGVIPVGIAGIQDPGTC